MIDVVAYMQNRVLMLICGILAACGGPAVGPEEALRLWVDEMETAASDKDRGAILDKISENYADARGNGRKDTGDKLLLYFLRQRSATFVATIDEMKIIDGSAAEMLVTVVMAGAGGGVFGLTANAYRFELELEKVDSEWLLIGAKWNQWGRDLR